MGKLCKQTQNNIVQIFFLLSADLLSAESNFSNLKKFE